MSFPRILYAQIAREEGHSEEFIAETLAYAEQLEAKNIQVIFSTLHLSMLVGVKYSLIQKILNDRKAYYENYEIKKRKGGTRQISSPHGALKKIQLWIYEKILSTLPLSENAFGFCPKKSIADNARVHVGQDFILNIDLLTFFDSIPEKRVYGIFKSLGYHTNLAVDLAKLCTCHPNNGFLNISDSEFISVLDTEHIDIFDDKVEKKIIYIDNKPVLPQGAPTSPSLSNIIACRLDKRLFGYAKKNNLKYSRYVDDITFSGKGECTIKLSVISKIIKEEKFEINKTKIRFFGRSSNKRIVTGLIVSDTIRVPKKFKKEIERHLHFCHKYGVEGHLKYLEAKYNNKKGYFKEWLRGKICYVNMVEPNEGKKLFSKYNSIDWGI